MGAFFAAFGPAGSSVSPFDVRAGVPVGAGIVGTLTLPNYSQVLLGVAYGGGGSQYLGSLQIPVHRQPAPARSLSLEEELGADMQDAIGGYSDSFEWRGDSYACVRSTEIGKFMLVPEGGFIDGADEMLIVAKSSFTAGFPKDGDLVDGGRFQIKSIDGLKKRSAVQLHIHLGSPD